MLSRRFRFPDAGVVVSYLCQLLQVVSGLSLVRSASDHEPHAATAFLEEVPDLVDGVEEVAVELIRGSDFIRISCFVEAHVSRDVVEAWAPISAASSLIGRPAIRLASFSSRNSGHAPHMLR